MHSNQDGQASPVEQCLNSLMSFPATVVINSGLIRAQEDHALLIAFIKCNPITEISLHLGGFSPPDINNLLAEIHGSRGLTKLRVSDAALFPTMIGIITSIIRNLPLRVLELPRNCINDAMACELAVAIQGNSSLIEIDLSDNAMTPKGILSFKPYLLPGAHPTLKKLTVKGNTITSYALSLLYDALQRREDFCLETSLCDDRALLYPSQIRCANIDIGQPPQISQQSSLLERLLHSQHNQCIEASEADLPRSSDVKVLAAFIQQNTVTSFCLRHSRLTQSDIHVILTALYKAGVVKNITLELGTIKRESIDRLVEISKVARLEQLTLSRNHIDDILIIPMLPIIKSFGLTYLDLSDNDIGDEGARIIAGSMRPSSSCFKLIWLSLGFNKITNTGMATFERAIETSNSVKAIFLDGNEIAETTRDTLQSVASQKPGFRLSLPHPIPICGTSARAGASFFLTGSQQAGYGSLDTPKSAQNPSPLSHEEVKLLRNLDNATPAASEKTLSTVSRLADEVLSSVSGFFAGMFTRTSSNGQSLVGVERSSCSPTP